MIELNMGMDQYLYIPFLMGWTSIYQLFWCSPGVPGFWPIPIYIKSSLGRTTPETNHKPVFFEAIWWCLSYRFGNGEKHYFQVFVWKWCSPEFSVISHHLSHIVPPKWLFLANCSPIFRRRGVSVFRSCSTPLMTVPIISRELGTQCAIGVGYDGWPVGDV